MQQTSVTTEFTSLSKTNLTQTLLYYKEAQSYYQQQMCKELYEDQLTLAKHIAQSKANYQTNSILNAFADVLKTIKISLDNAIAKFKKMYTTFDSGDIYDAIENNFVFYFLSVTVDIETYTDTKVKEQLQAHYNDVHACYRDIILFVKTNKI